jgi:hypothetical protein
MWARMRLLKNSELGKTSGTLTFSFNSNSKVKKIKERK